MGTYHKALVLLILSIIVTTPACSRERVFSGRVIDADTREPIEGAVVVAHWHTTRPSIIGSDTQLKEVKETLTDHKGEWSIVGEAGRSESPIPFFILFGMATLRYTMEPEFIIFKPGYCPWPDGFSIESCRGKLEPEGIDKIAEGKQVELPQLTKREDRIRGQGVSLPLGAAGLEKMKELIRLINEERGYLGLK